MNGKKRKNWAEIMLGISAYVMGLFGFIAGISQLRDSTITGMTYIILGLVSMTVLIGLSEIIYLLEDLKKELKKR